MADRSKMDERVALLEERISELERRTFAPG